MIRSLQLRGGAVLACSLVVFAAAFLRILFDNFVPPVTHGARSALTTYAAIATYAVAGCYGGFRTGRMVSGVGLAVLSHLVGHALTITLTLALFFSVIADDARKLQEFQATGGFGEVLFLPVMVLPLVALLGAAGGAIGGIARRHMVSVSSSG
jgi:hypothetical protein